MALADFETLAEANNPTLKQANALVRRSQDRHVRPDFIRTRSAGYQGEQIRGGSYGGGEQGGFVQQTIVLGGKLGCGETSTSSRSRSDQIGVEEQTSVFTTMSNRLSMMRCRTSGRGTTAAIARGRARRSRDRSSARQRWARRMPPTSCKRKSRPSRPRWTIQGAASSTSQSFHMLAALAGKDDLPASPLQGELGKTPDLNAEQMVDAVVANSPTVKRAQQETAVADARLKDAKRESVPDLQLRAGEQYNGEPVSENPVKPVGAQSFATAGINIPLWNRNQGNVGAAKTEIELTHQEVARKQLLLRQKAAPLAQSIFPPDSRRNAIKHNSFRRQQERMSCT